MTDFLADLRYSLRLLFKNPGVTVVAVLAIALGIGANTAIFSVVNAVLLRPLPFRQPGQLVTMRIDVVKRNISGALGPYCDINEWRKQAKSFECLSAWSADSANLTDRGEPERVSLWRVNAGFFPMLGVRMALGRDFRPEDDQPGSPRVAIISQVLWRRFGSDGGIQGRTILLDANPYTVIGVLPPDFKLDEKPPDLYVPIALAGGDLRGAWTYSSYARLKPGVTIAQAQAEMDTIMPRVEKAFPRPLNGNRAHVWGVREYLVKDVRLSLMVLLGAVALVLLIACANVANLLLARASARQKEMGIRAAMGAGRWRVVRQLLTESVLLAVIGAVLGLLLAYCGIRTITAIGTSAYPMLKETRLDPAVLGFTLLVSLVTGLVFGIAPALAASRNDLQEVLKEGARSSSEAGGRSRLRGVLVVSEVALALLLMVGASLMIRSLLKLHDVNPGFNPDGVLTAAVNLPPAKYSTPPQQIAFHQRLRERLAAMPGVIGIGMTSHLPLGGVNSGMPMLIQGRPVSGPADVPVLWYRSVDPGYFQAMRIPLLKGRFFDGRDVAGAQRVAIVNQTMARRFWPNEDPVGKRVGNGAPNGWITVVGVVSDVRHMSLAADPDVEIYFPFPQFPMAAMKLVLRTDANPLRFAPALQRAVLDVDPDQPISRVASMDQNMLDSLASKRLSTILLGIFAGIALLLAAIGIYGVISFSVTCRKHEIGIRMALGARHTDVQRMVVRQGTVLALIGVAIGLAAAAALTRIIQTMLFQVRSTDPLVYAAVALGLTAVAALASYIPARRAARVDPMLALRYE
jgi:putative ABC transport system permease protein